MTLVDAQPLAWLCHRQFNSVLLYTPMTACSHGKASNGQRHILQCIFICLGLHKLEAQCEPAAKEACVCAHQHEPYHDGYLLQQQLQPPPPTPQAQNLKSPHPPCSQCTNQPQQLSWPRKQGKLKRMIRSSSLSSSSTHCNRLQSHNHKILLA